MKLEVYSVHPGHGSATVWQGEGIEPRTGHVVGFAGDWRPMANLAGMLAEAGGAVEAWIEPWQVMYRLDGTDTAQGVGH